MMPGLVNCLADQQLKILRFAYIRKHGQALTAEINLIHNGSMSLDLEEGD